MFTIKDEILAQTNQGLDVFRHYFGHNIQPKKLFKNPYYNDTKPSCSVFMSSYKGSYFLKDNGNPEYCGDCFTIVGKLVGLNAKTDFISIAKTIVNDMNIFLRDNKLRDDNFRKTDVKHVGKEEYNNIQTNIGEQEAKPFTVKHKDFTEDELKYFSQSGIDKETLDRYNVKSVKFFKSISSLGKEYTLYNYPNNPMFDYSRIYNNEQSGKLYMPQNNVRYIHYGKKPLDFIFGYEQLPAKGDMVILSAGERDVLTLASAGYNAITLNSETATLHQNLIDDLSNRFNKILVMYDTDETGIKASTKLCNDFFPHLVRIELPLNGTKQEKDITDLFKKFPNQTAKEILKEVIKEDIVKHNTMLKSQQPSTVEQIKKTQLKP